MASGQVSSAFRLGSTEKLWGFVYKLDKHKSSDQNLVLKVFLQYYFLRKSWYVINYFFIYSRICSELYLAFVGSLRTVYKERKVWFPRSPKLTAKRKRWFFKIKPYQGVTRCNVLRQSLGYQYYARSRFRWMTYYENKLDRLAYYKEQKSGYESRKRRLEEKLLRINKKEKKSLLFFSSNRLDIYKGRSYITKFGLQRNKRRKKILMKALKYYKGALLKKSIFFSGVQKGGPVLLPKSSRESHLIRTKSLLGFLKIYRRKKLLKRLDDESSARRYFVSSVQKVVGVRYHKRRNLRNIFLGSPRGNKTSKKISSRKRLEKLFSTNLKRKLWLKFYRSAVSKRVLSRFLKSKAKKFKLGSKNKNLNYWKRVWWLKRKVNFISSAQASGAKYWVKHCFSSSWRHFWKLKKVKLKHIRNYSLNKFRKINKNYNQIIDYKKYFNRKQLQRNYKFFLKAKEKEKWELEASLRRRFYFVYDPRTRKTIMCQRFTRWDPQQRYRSNNRSVLRKYPYLDKGILREDYSSITRAGRFRSFFARGGQKRFRKSFRYSSKRVYKVTRSPLKRFVKLKYQVKQDKIKLKGGFVNRLKKKILKKFITRLRSRFTSLCLYGRPWSIKKTDMKNSFTSLRARRIPICRPVISRQNALGESPLVIKKLPVYLDYLTKRWAAERKKQLQLSDPRRVVWDKQLRFYNNPRNARKIFRWRRFYRKKFKRKSKHIIKYWKPRWQDLQPHMMRRKQKNWIRYNFLGFLSKVFLKHACKRWLECLEQEKPQWFYSGVSSKLGKTARLRSFYLILKQYFVKRTALSKLLRFSLLLARNEKFNQRGGVKFLSLIPKLLTPESSVIAVSKESFARSYVLDFSSIIRSSGLVEGPFTIEVLQGYYRKKIFDGVILNLSKIVYHKVFFRLAKIKRIMDSKKWHWFLIGNMLMSNRVSKILRFPIWIRPLSIYHIVSSAWKRFIRKVWRWAAFSTYLHKSLNKVLRRILLVMVYSFRFRSFYRFMKMLGFLFNRHRNQQRVVRQFFRSIIRRGMFRFKRLLGWQLTLRGKMNRRPRAREITWYRYRKPAPQNNTMQIIYSARTVVTDFGMYYLRMWVYYWV